MRRFKERRRQCVIFNSEWKDRARTEVNGCISHGKRREDLVGSVDADIHQHVCIGGAHDSLHLLIPRLVRDIHFDWITTIIIFEDPLVRDRHDMIIVKLEPSSHSIGLDNSKMVSIV
jgi:hypothetical protein